VGVAKPFYFLLMPSYWFPKEAAAPIETVSGIQLSGADQNIEQGIHTKEAIPEEPVNEKFTGRPTVTINKLRKTFGTQLAVNNLSFKMYENQIFALLGHNGAGKVRTIYDNHPKILFFTVASLLIDNNNQHVDRVDQSRQWSCS
jgi:ABC-type multidrug transport system fused ATPase/permease subunit